MNTTPQPNPAFAAHFPWQFPENPFNYRGLVSQPAGIGQVPPARYGTKVAIIGAGVSGLAAAYELMRLGLHPVIYEAARSPDGTPRIGGRTYTYRFPGDPLALAEIGAMRFPTTHRTLTYYLDRFGLDYSRPFPDPMTVPTVLYFQGQKHFIPLGGVLPPALRRAAAAWTAFITPLKAEMTRVWDDPKARRCQWQAYVRRYSSKSFYEVLHEQGLSPKEIKLFGHLGFGTGGFDSLYPVSFIEILRGVICRWYEDQRLVKGGIDQLAQNFWTRLRPCQFFGETSVARLNSGQPGPAVQEISTPPDPQGEVVITDARGQTETFAAVIVSCSLRALEMDIRVNRSTFSADVWDALRNIQLICSGKVFVRTRTAFWKDREPTATLNTTITDEPIRAAYLFDFDDTPSGVICLSYTWGDSSIKFDALSPEERVQLCLSILAKIYGQDLVSDQIMETVSFAWQEARGYHGAFKLTYPGQYEYQQALFRQPFYPRPPRHNGVFLAGETTSWAGGWVEGALHSGLDAACAVILRLGGVVHRPTHVSR